MRTLCAVALVALCLALASPAMAAKHEAAPPPASQLGFYVAAPNGDVQTFALDNLFAGLAAGGVCNGGTCQPPGGGTPLSCPASGGPTCKEGELCACTCITATIGGQKQVIAVNQCIAPTKGGVDTPETPTTTGSN
jgi:hypothetical protein